MEKNRRAAAPLLGWMRVLLSLLTGGCALIALVLTPMHWIDTSTPRLVELAAFTPLGTPFAFLALAMGFGLICVPLRAAGRLHRLSAITATVTSGALLALHVWWIAPLYVGSRPATAGRGIVLLSQNFEYGSPARLAQIVRDDSVDVLVLTNMDDHRVRQVLASAIPDLLTHSIGTRTGQNLASVVFSRFPIDSVRNGPHSSHADLMRLRTTTLGDVDLVAVHPQAPYTTRWRPDYHALNAYLRIAAPQPSSRPTIVAGDFNATLDNAPLRGIIDLGYADVMTQRRAGLQPTWPDSSFVHYFGVTIPRLVSIDHVLVSSRLAAASVRTVHGTGADHSGILTRIAHKDR